VTESAVRIVNDEGDAPEESGSDDKIRRGNWVLIPAATLALVAVGFVFFSLSNPPWRPSGSTPIVDVYLKLDTQPGPADEVLDVLSSHEAVLDERLLRQPPTLQGWVSPSECDYRPIVRLLVPSVVDAKAVTEFVFDTYADSVVSFIITGHGYLSSPVSTGCTSGTVRMPFKETVWD
jgi:hypothetical protein